MSQWYGNVCKRNPKITNGVILHFLLTLCPVSLNLNLHGLKSRRNAQVCLLFDDIKSFR